MQRNYVLCNTLSKHLKIKTEFDWYIWWRFVFGAVWKKQLYKEEEDEHSRGIFRWHLSNSKVISETTGYGDVFQICRIAWKILWKVLLLHFQKEVQELINSMKSSLFWILRLLIFSCSSWQTSHFYSTGVLINNVLCGLIFIRLFTDILIWIFIILFIMLPEHTFDSFPWVQVDKKDFNCLNVDSQKNLC